MRYRPPIEQLRAAGRKRAEAFTPAYQVEMGRRRAQQTSFIEHNRRIASDGYSAQSAYMRGPTGLRLLHPEHIQFLLPEQLVGPHGAPLSYEQQRLYYGLYAWKAIWDGLAPQPQVPAEGDYLAAIRQVQERLHHGLNLEHPLHIVYAAANDFCDETGEPWAPRKQRRLFRQALELGRRAAIDTVRHWQQQALAQQQSRPRRLGQRRPSTSMTPTFRHGESVPAPQYGRPDLPSYHPYNLTPQRRMGCRR